MPEPTEELLERKFADIAQKVEQGGVQCLSDEDIRLLKDIKDPRVFFNTEQGTIEIAEANAQKELDSIAPETFDREQLRQALQEHTIFVTKNKEGNVVNFCTARQSKEGVLWVPFIYTIEKEQKHGHAKQMLEYMIERHAKKACILSKDSSGKLSERMLRELGFNPTDIPNEWRLLK